MSKINETALRDLDLSLREMKGNSVNYNETDRLIVEFRNLIKDIQNNNEDESLLEKFLTKGEYLKDHLLELPIHATANYWAKECHLKYSKKFESQFDFIKDRLKY